jgi:hypothetical protein
MIIKERQINRYSKDIIDETGVFHIYKDILTRFEETLGIQSVNVKIPNVVKAIGTAAFKYNHNVTSVCIPDSVTTIETQAFAQLFKLENVNLPKNLTTIGEYAFYACSALPSIQFPKSLKEINDRAFSGCRSLKYIHIPCSIEAVGCNAFCDCSNVEHVVLDSTSTVVHQNAFDVESPNLRSISINGTTFFFSGNSTKTALKSPYFEYIYDYMTTKDITIIEEFVQTKQPIVLDLLVYAAKDNDSDAIRYICDNIDDLIHLASELKRVELSATLLDIKHGADGYEVPYMHL